MSDPKAEGNSSADPAGNPDWSQRGKFWAAAAPQGASVNDGPNQVLIRLAGVAPGMSVLDLASGTGEPAISIAQAVGPAGQVTAMDISADMLGGVRRRAETLGLGNVETRKGNLNALDLPEAAWDAATCRFGLMFAEDAVATLGAVRKALKPGGRLAVMVHGPPDRNHMFTATRQAVMRFLGREDDGRAVRRFRFSGAGELADVFRAAGFRDVVEEFIEKVDRRPAADGGRDADGTPFWNQLLMRGFGETVAAMNDTERARLDEAILEAYQPLRRTDEDNGDHYAFDSTERAAAGAA